MENTWSSIQIWNIEDSYFTYDEEEKQNIEIAKANSDLVFNPKYIIIQTEWLNELSLIQAYMFWFIDYYLCSEEWKRFYFTNEQLSKICRCSERTVQESIQVLERLWYIETSRKVKVSWWQIRFIKLKSRLAKFALSETQNLHFPTSKKVPTNNKYNKLLNNNKLLINDSFVEINNQISSTIVEDIDNNISINNNILDSNISRARARENFDEVFSNLWNYYPWKKLQKNDAKKYFNKFIKKEKDLNLLRYALPKYIDSVQDKQFLVLLRTYLSKQMYLDYEDEFNNLSKEETQEIKQEENIEINHKLKFKRSYDD